MDPVEPRLVGLHQDPRHTPVGGDHQFLDQPVGAVAGRGLDGHHPALGVEDQLGLGEVEVEAAALATRSTQPFRRLGQQLEGVGEPLRFRPAIDERGISNHPATSS